ncbi:CatB-related O-acetyltransferase [Selenihalanaerobacter shriftii]|uniref:Acetyltransferase (Isoleucine patch superfamily) n=1 Tax=Selenihalanaerobacter shriftii TaxID=142842 RepID=A0A1T4R0M7_9FIRM|nr:CatB-related O-acetyltransferase [Selenihalanaerobacter shriftii]SKA09612.1 Acetyltransferase (isoleucine patch superfamily) [Selenihalanaerobacter shriftii]
MKRLIKFILSFFKNLMFESSIKISPLSYFDNDCKFEENIYIDRFCNLHNVKIGEYSYVGYGTFIFNCQIGKYCSIGPDVKIGPGKHPTHFVSTSPIFYKKDNPLGVKFVEKKYFKESDRVVIGNDVWIGANAIIMDGVKINNGAIIASGAVVTKDVEPYAIVGGVPAKLIKYRFNKKKVQRLLEVEWWEWDKNEIKKHINKFRDIERFLK